MRKQSRRFAHQAANSCMLPVRGEFRCNGWHGETKVPYRPTRRGTPREPPSSFRRDPNMEPGRLVCEAVESVLRQEGGDLEVIVVDDGSTDGTAQAIERRFGQSVKLLRMATRSGVGAARNEGVWQATGDLLSFLDSDDLWLPGKLKAELDVLERFPDAEAIVSDSRFIVDGQFIGTSRFAENGALAATGGRAQGSMILRGCGRYPVMEFRPVGSRCAALPSPSSANPCSPRTSIGAKTGSSRSGCTRNAASWPCPRYGRTCAGSTTVHVSGGRAPDSPGVESRKLCCCAID